MKKSNRKGTKIEKKKEKDFVSGYKSRELRSLENEFNFQLDERARIESDFLRNCGEKGLAEKWLHEDYLQRKDTHLYQLEKEIEREEIRIVDELPKDIDRELNTIRGKDYEQTARYREVLDVMKAGGYKSEFNKLVRSAKNVDESENVDQKHRKKGNKQHDDDDEYEFIPRVKHDEHATIKQQFGKWYNDHCTTKNKLSIPGKALVDYLDDIDEYRRDARFEHWCLKPVNVYPENDSGLILYGNRPLSKAAIEHHNRHQVDQTTGDFRYLPKSAICVPHLGYWYKIDKFFFVTKDRMYNFVRRMDLRFMYDFICIVLIRISSVSFNFFKWTEMAKFAAKMKYLENLYIVNACAYNGQDGLLTMLKLMRIVESSWKMMHDLKRNDKNGGLHMPSYAASGGESFDFVRFNLLLICTRPEVLEMIEHDFGLLQDMMLEWWGRDVMDYGTTEIDDPMWLSNDELMIRNLSEMAKFLGVEGKISSISDYVFESDWLTYTDVRVEVDRANSHRTRSVFESSIANLFFSNGRIKARMLKIDRALQERVYVCNELTHPDKLYRLYHVLDSYNFSGDALTGSRYVESVVEQAIDELIEVSKSMLRGRMNSAEVPAMVTKFSRVEEKMEIDFENVKGMKILMQINWY